MPRAAHGTPGAVVHGPRPAPAPAHLDEGVGVVEARQHRRRATPLRLGRSPRRPAGPLLPRGALRYRAAAPPTGGCRHVAPPPRDAQTLSRERARRRRGGGNGGDACARGESARAALWRPLAAWRKRPLGEKTGGPRGGGAPRDVPQTGETHRPLPPQAPTRGALGLPTEQSLWQPQQCLEWGRGHYRSKPLTATSLFPVFGVQHRHKRLGKPREPQLGQ